ncbi:type IV pilus assembly protein FimV [Pusillimonas minor]|uniref:Peptidoglycan-binding protein LysM n=1 Tax=Pusillimonas minor TaxID=2697024 RepID=A0A842HQE9_9BURK|nr:FimV/HubP family polar landmark protein [Pusillimonas minor]MBC2769570.1 peptidoglycan-binding protein LysM [Pusillimonas minor]
MHKSHRWAVNKLSLRVVSAVILAAASFSSSVHAMSFGHSRLLSPTGQPLRIQVPVHNLTPDDVQSLSVVVAPASAWQQAGLTPPVDLSSLQVGLVDGMRAGSRTITVSSPQALSANVADLLLLVRSASGQQQHQVSLLAPTDMQVVRAAQSQAPVMSASSGAGSPPQGQGESRPAIQVRQGDTMFSLARRHAVPGVSLYQWMVAVQLANPNAFINDNVNLVKAGASLVVPDQAALTALTDAQARRVFQQHAAAFAQYRQRLARQTGAPLQPGATDRGGVSPAANASSASVSASQNAADKLVLASAQSASGTQANDDTRVATQKNTEEVRERIADLEENVKTLNQALQQQGPAATEAITDGVEALAEAVGQVAQTASNLASGADTGSGAGASAGASGAEASAGAANGGANGGATALAAGASSATEGATAAANGAAGAGQAGAAAGNSTGGGATESAAGTAAAGSSGTSTGGSSAAGTAGQGLVVTAPSAGSTSTPGASLPGGNTTSSDASSASSSSSKAVTPVSWFQDNLLVIITGILAIIVLVVAWLLRRVGRTDDTTDTGITEDMVRERLQGINLDLDDDQKPGTRT